MEDPEVCHPEGELLVGAGPVVEDQAVAGAVHRLQAKSLLLNIKSKERNIKIQWFDSNIKLFPSLKPCISFGIV